MYQTSAESNKKVHIYRILPAQNRVYHIILPQVTAALPYMDT